MKVQKYLVMAVIAGLILTGCGDDKDDNNPVGPSGSNGSNATAGTLKATISGNLSLNFSSSLAVAHVADEDFQITGSMMSGNSLYTLSLVVLKAPGQFTIALINPSDADNGDASAGFTLSAETGAGSYYSISGTLTVTSASSTRLKGTFQFTAVNDADGSQITVAQGTFDVPINY